jgi:hypothetical protein
MSFEIDTLCVIAPLDPNEGDIYNELINEDAQSLIIREYIQHHRMQGGLCESDNDGELSWRSVHSYDTDSEDAMTRWKE